MYNRYRYSEIHTTRPVGCYYYVELETTFVLLVLQVWLLSSSSSLLPQLLLVFIQYYRHRTSIAFTVLRYHSFGRWTPIVIVNSRPASDVTRRTRRRYIQRLHSTDIPRYPSAGNPTTVATVATTVFIGRGGGSS